MSRSVFRRKNQSNFMRGTPANVWNEFDDFVDDRKVLNPKVELRGKVSKPKIVAKPVGELQALPIDIKKINVKRLPGQSSLSLTKKELSRPKRRAPKPIPDAIQQILQKFLK